MSPLSPARASVQHLAPQSPAMLAAKNPTSEWNTTEEKCDTTGLLAIGKVLSQSVLGLDHHQPIDHHDIVPKIEPIDDEPSQSYYTLKVDVASEDGDSTSAAGDDDDNGDDEHQTIDLSTKPRECSEELTTVYCTTSVNNNNSFNHNNNNHGDGDKIIKGSAKRKKLNPMQIVLAKKSKIREGIEDDDVGNGNDAAAVALDDGTEINEESAAAAATIITTTTTTTTTTIATATTASTTTIEDEPVTVKRKNSIKSTDVKSEQEILDECMTEEILRSVLTDESDGDDMITEAFVKKKGVPKKTKKGKKDRKNGGNKKEMTGK
jgi:hypothetical protein